jgi:hypothetical protein
MNTLAEIELAAQALPPEQKEELIRFLSTPVGSAASHPARARLVRDGDDVLLEAPPDAPPMTADNVKRMLENWP